VDNLGQAGNGATATRSLWSRRGFRIGVGTALVLAIGGASYGIAAAVSGGGSPATSAPPTTTPGPVRPGPFGTGGAVSGAYGTVRSVGSDSFVLNTSSGEVTVDVSSSTSYVDRLVAVPSFADVKVGAAVSALGARNGSTLDASRVSIGFGGGRGFGVGGSRTIGTVTSVSSSSFVLDTVGGTKVTVEVNGQTSYLQRGGGAVSLKSLKAGDRVAVSGSASSTQIVASTVLVLPAGAFGGGGFGSGGGGFGGPTG